MQKKTVISVMVVVMLLTVSLYFVSGTYARYISEYEGTAKTQVAKWNVQVNSTTGTEKSQTVDLEFEVQGNEYVVDGKIAPNVTAISKATVNLDKTEVAVDLIVEKGADFDQKITELGLNEDEIAFEIALDEDSKAKAESGDVKGDTSAPFVIPLPAGAAFDDSTGLINVDLKLTWTNNEDNNEKDTKAGINATSLDLPVKLTVRQHIG